MEYLDSVLKKTGKASLVSSIIFAIIGIILIAYPEGTIKFISYVIGIMFIAVGLYKGINYIKNKEIYNMFNYDMALGIIAIIIGAVTIAYSNQIGAIFRIMIGIWIVYSAIIRMSLSAKLKVIESNTWIYSLIIAFAMIICGVFIICNSGAIVVTIGTIILIYSILDIIESIIFLSNINNLTKLITERLVNEKNENVKQN